MSIKQYMKRVKAKDDPAIGSSSSSSSSSSSDSTTTTTNTSIEKVDSKYNNSSDDDETNEKMEVKKETTTTITTRVIVFGSTRAIGTQLVTSLSMQHPTWDIVAVVKRGSFVGSYSTSFDHLLNVSICYGDSTNKHDVLTLSQNADIVFSCTTRGDVFVTQPTLSLASKQTSSCLWSWKKVTIWW